MPMSTRGRITWMAIVAFVALFTAGCGPGGLPQADVSGKVTFQGNPIPGVLVSFTPEKGPGASGKTDAEGKYALMTKKPGDGAVIGNHVVTISQPVQGMILEKGKPPRMAPPPKILIPPKFAAATTSGLTAEVKDDDNTINFELAGK